MIQQQTDSVVQPGGASSASLTTVAAISVAYDSRGNKAATYAPFTGATRGVFAAPASTAERTLYTYDGLNRATSVQKPDGSRVTMDHITVALQTTTTDECFASPTTSCPGGKTVETRDWDGRPVQIEAYEQSILKGKQQFKYDGLGRLAKTRQWDGTGLNPATDTDTTYDSLGRRIAVTDPDSGTWIYHYDAVGNLRVRDDPTQVPARHIQHCYDALDRITKTYYFDSNFTADLPPTGTSVNCIADADVDYSYDYTGSGSFGLGRLWSVDDQSGVTSFIHDERGRTTIVSKAVDWGGDVEFAEFEYAYDDADHVTDITYPDDEIVAVGYDAAGRVSRLDSSNGDVYLGNLTYDVFGRPRIIQHGDPTTPESKDEHKYYGADRNFRLESIVTTEGADRRVDLHYETYSARGQLTKLTDRLHPTGVLSNSANYTYDGLGRLTSASGPNLTNHSYSHSALGNLDLKAAKALGYTPAPGAPMKPHQVKTYDGSSDLAHDNNGNRTRKNGVDYVYDHEDRLINVGAGSLQMVYDYSGYRAVKVVNDTEVTRYFGPLAESVGGILHKYYFAGDVRIAKTTYNNWNQIASSGLGGTWVMVARGSLSQPALVLLMRREVGQVLPLAIVATVFALSLVRRGYRRRVAGVRIAPGVAEFAIIIWFVGTLPLPLVLRPLAPGVAHAGGGGGGGPPPQNVYHFHVDRLGSTQAITMYGDVQQYVRYDPYGTIRGRYNSAGGTSFIPSFKYEFTGYETDVTTGLQYAGARHYDPDLGSFLTHDPAREFASPYSYVGGDPINLDDPNGECVEIASCVIVGAVIGAVVSGVVSAAQAAANGARGSEIAAAAAQGAAFGALTGAGLGLLSGAGQAAVGPAFKQALAAALAPYGTYSTVQAFRSGQNVAGAVGAVMLAFSVYGAFAAEDIAATPNAGSEFATADVGDVVAEGLEYDQRFGIGDFTVGGWEAGAPVCPNGCVTPAGVPAALLLARAAPIIFRAAQYAPRLWGLVASGTLLQVNRGLVQFTVQGNYQTALRWFDAIFGRFGAAQTQGTTRYIELVKGIAANVRPYSSYHAPTLELKVYNTAIKFRFIDALPRT